MVELERSRELLQELGLYTAADLLDARLEDATHRDLTYLSFLHELLNTEQQERKRRSEDWVIF